MGYPGILHCQTDPNETNLSAITVFLGWISTFNWLSGTHCLAGDIPTLGPSVSETSVFTDQVLQDRSPFFHSKSPFFQDKSPFFQDKSPFYHDKSPFLLDKWQFSLGQIHPAEFSAGFLQHRGRFRGRGKGRSRHRGGGWCCRRLVEGTWDG